MLEGAGGNIAASVGEDGIVIVDDQYAPLADKIAAALKGIGVTDKPVRFVINTHYHGDHTGGNLAVCHRRLDRHRAGQCAQAPGNRRQGRNPGVAMGMDQTAAPKGGAAHHHLRSRRDRAPQRRRHSRAALSRRVIPMATRLSSFPKANVVHMGDDFVRYGYPFIDVISGGSVQGIIAACDKVASILPADVKVIPGHGQLSTWTRCATIRTC